MNRKLFVENLIENIAINKSGIIVKDLKSNFEKYALSENLSDDELVLLLISLSKTLGFKDLNSLVLNFATSLKIDENIIEEAKQIPGINGMLNTYHKFRHYIDLHDKITSNEYGTVGLKMGILSKTIMNPGIFEIIFISISVLNGCEKCVLAHENHAMQIGVSKKKVHDAVRLTAIIKGLSEI